MQHSTAKDIRNRARVGATPTVTGKHARTVVACIKPSAVAEAGFGGFGTCVGRSGQRYVFSATSVEQAMLYDKTLFAVGNITSGQVTVGSDVLSLWFDGIPGDAELYVHILDENVQDCGSVLDDLRLDI